jgi:uncharacterized protein (TIGR00299 family) protein
MHLHFDCFSGISGDMVLGALVDAGLPLRDLQRGLKALRITGYRLRASEVTRAGLRATKVDVRIDRGMRTPLPLARIRAILSSSRLPLEVKERARAAFERLADAEGIAHRVKPTQVRFHEVGVLDSFVDVVGGILGCHLLGVGTVTASPVNVGAGTMPSDHGLLPVPGPAVAALAKGVPVFSAGPQRELATPTGVTLLRTLVREYTSLPMLTPTAIGYGAGTADPPGWPNVLRVYLGESSGGIGAETDSVVQIETNLDDLNPQAYELVMERLFRAGALDVTLTPVVMKRGRPGIVLSALAPPEKAEAVAATVLRETTALGVRLQRITRQILPRRVDTVSVGGSRIRVKVAAVGGNTVKAAPEYQDCKRLSEETGRPVRDIMEEASSAYRIGAKGVKRRRSGR